jgi:glycerol-3-phosphate cytidylyltransferase-like family protein
MNWHDAVKSSEQYWKPPSSSWKFWEMCCMGDSKKLKPIVPESKKAQIYDEEKQITHYWSKEDDRKLVKLAEKYKCDWNVIADKFTDKSASQLSRRWKIKLNPNVKRSPWTDEEDIILKTLVLEFGYEWETISKYIQGRIPESIKKRFFSVILPQLSQRDSNLLRERLESKPDVPMDIEVPHVDDQNREEYLEMLQKKVEDLESAMKGTLDQIEELESDLYESQSLLS